MLAALSLFSTTLHAADHVHSPSLLGPLGLNSVPSARMDTPGTIRAAVSTLDPYMHGSIGLQLAKPLFVSLRQSAEVSKLNADPDRLYPGLDMKLRLLDETAYRPEIAVGLQSAVGHKRMAGEYIVLSKRYKAFDFTFGLGWGRLGSKGHIKNPFGIFGSHFDDDRPADGEMPNAPDDWFTGEEAGFFGGVEYFLPLTGFSVKLDYNADSYTAERASIAGFNRASPWGASVNYHYKGASASLGMQGTDKLMGRISLQSTPAQWPITGKKYARPEPFYPKRGLILEPVRIKNRAAHDGLALSSPYEENGGLHARLALLPHSPAPQQIGRSARAISTYGGPDAERIALTPMILGLRGPTVKLMRADLERALAHGQSSPEELWAKAEFSYDTPAQTRDIPRHIGFYLTLSNEFSLSEEDSGTLYRTSLLAHLEPTPVLGDFSTGTSLRLNIKDNLDRLEDIRPIALLPVRSDIDLFTQDRLSLERSYINWMRTLAPDLHASLSVGYLEEMYGGIGGELLYRPFDSRFALGLELWEAFRRNPDTDLHLGFNGDHVLSGHLNAWYDIPHHDLTLHAKAGRYLAEDIGATLGLEKAFKNGAKINAFVTVTDNSDIDPFGGTTHAYHGLELNLPLGAVRYVPEGSRVTFAALPFGRDTGQSVDAPLRLYDLTENLTLDHLAQHWDEILD